MNLATLPPGAAFLDTLAADWLAQSGPDPMAVADGLILLPTRRAARALATAFLAQTDGRPLLLPRIVAFGALDEAPMTLSGALDIAPAVPDAVRLAQLTRLVMALNGRYGAPATADRAWPLAAELAALMDEAERAEIDLASVLPLLAAEDYAQHWQVTLEFMTIVTQAWPAWLRDNGLMNPAARQVALLDAQRAAWSANPPATPIWAAGSTGGIPAVARLLRIVAGMPAGRVVLPGLDLDLPDAAWDAIADSHPQAGLRRLLTRLGATRGDVRGGPATGRAATLNRALLPASHLTTWRTHPPLPPGEGRGEGEGEGQAEGEAGLTRLSPADQQEEAVAIALILRDAIAAPETRAALVTPDRGLAGRVAAELLRFGVIVDDSAGEPLAHTPPATFLRLLAEAVVEGLRPVPLLALLKHPFAAAGLTPAACRSAARALERHTLRGQAPKPGLAGLRQVATIPADAEFVERIAAALAPVLAVAALDQASPADALAALLQSAEALAATPDGAGPLWSGEDGHALASHLDHLLSAIGVLPPQPPDVLPGLLEASLAGIAVRTRRALRGRGAGAQEHPRVFIWGLLEARLQTAELIVLGGLTEGVWPPVADPGPWMSRPMRAAAGLPSPEEAVGQMAHDWVMTACAAPRVVLSCPQRRDGAPTVPARWLTRLEAMLRGTGRMLPLHPACDWARALDQPAEAARRAPPAPIPPVADRPRRLSVTDVETWLRDPYAIYAKHVLRLRALDPLEQSIDAADYGSVVHKAIAAFLTQAAGRFPPDAEAMLEAAMDEALDRQELRPALAAWWRPRLRRIATWLAGAERRRRLGQGFAALASERRGDWVIGVTPAFTLTGRADRIERRYDGTIAILDYKTGTPPTGADVAAGLSPQLPLEAAMAEAGAFGAELTGAVNELTYWHLTGGLTPGKEHKLFTRDREQLPAVVAEAGSKLAQLIRHYDDPAQPYRSRPVPGAAPRFSDYAQLARVAEWAALDDDG